LKQPRFARIPLARKPPVVYGFIHPESKKSIEADKLAHPRETASSARSAGGNHGEDRRDLSDTLAEATRAVAHLQPVPARGQTRPSGAVVPEDRAVSTFLRGDVWAFVGMITEWTAGLPASSPPWREVDRLAALRAYGVLDTPREPAFDEITHVAALVCKAPIALVSFIEDTRQFFKAEVGLGVRETPRDVSICAHAILQRDLFVVPDATQDSRFASNPLVTGEPHLRFYAGALLMTPEGLPIGTLCILDNIPRPEGLSEEQVGTLHALARAVMAQLELHRTNKALAESEGLLRTSEERLQLALNAGHIGTWVWDIPRNVIIADPNLAQMFSVDPHEAAKGAAVEQFMQAVHPEDRSRVEAIMAEVMERGGEYEVEHRLVQTDGTVRWIVARGCCEHDQHGRPVRFPGVTVEITDLKQAQEAEELLARELSHRIKNIFAVVGGLAALSAQGHPEAKGFVKDFRQRVNALTQAHEYVRPHSPERVRAGAGGSVLGLMRVLRAPYRQGGRERFVIEGDDAPIGAKSATALALIMHEQATNAVKYGALSTETGQVWLTGKRDGETYRLTWEEIGGPPVAGMPERKGFGTVMASRGLKGQLNGSITHEWSPGGLVALLSLPTENLLQ
jgi:PAS domain S-box-containing protein